MGERINPRPTMEEARAFCLAGTVECLQLGVHRVGEAEVPFCVGKEDTGLCPTPDIVMERFADRVRGGHCRSGVVGVSNGECPDEYHGVFRDRGRGGVVTITIGDKYGHRPPEEGEVVSGKGGY